MKNKIAIILLSFLVIPVFNAECKDEFILSQAKAVDIYFSGQIAINENDEDKVLLNVSNIFDDFYVVIENETTGERKTYKNIENGFFSVETPKPIERYTYTVRVYSSATECENELLIKEKLVSLRYNSWALSTECEDLRNKIYEEKSIKGFNIPNCCEYFTEKDYLEDSFKKEYNEFLNKINEPSLKDKLIDKFYKYYYFALVPIFLLSMYYLFALRKIRLRKKAQNEE